MESEGIITIRKEDVDQDISKEEEIDVKDGEQRQSISSHEED